MSNLKTRTSSNIDPNLHELPENASLDMNVLEGVTSWYSPLLPDLRRLELIDATGYGGCAPLDKEHSYKILCTVPSVPHLFLSPSLNHA